MHAIISRTDLPAGTQLTKAHVTVAEVPEEDLPVGYYTRIGEVIGRHLKVDVVEGQLLVESMLTAKMPNIMRPGTQPFHLSLSKRETGVSLLQPDCIANVYVTFLLRNKEEGGSVIIAPLLQQIRILTVDDRTITGPQRETSHSSSRAWNDGIVLLTLEVTDLQTRALELAQRMGKLTLHLRNPTDTRSYPGTVLLLEANGSVSTKRDCDPEDPLGMINYARVIGAAVSVPGIPDLTGAGSADQLP